MLHNYSFEALDRSAKIPKKPRLSDSGCTKSVFAKNELDRYGFKYDPNINNERLIAAGDNEMRVCGVLQSLYTYNGRTDTMHGLVTPDLTSEIIVSRVDAEKIGAININRSDTVSKLNAIRKRKTNTGSDTTTKRVKLTTPPPGAKQAAREPAGENKEPAAPAKKAINTNKAAQETPAGQPQAPKVLHPAFRDDAPTQKVPAPTVLHPAFRDGSDQYTMILSPLSKTKILRKIEEWKAKFSILSDEMNPEPMIGPSMLINLKKGMQGAPRKAMTAVIIPLHYKKASNELMETLLRNKVIRRVKQSSVSPFQSRAFVVEKPGGIEKGVRLVIDFSEANQWIERPTHPFTPGNDLINLIPDTAKFFCKLDCLWGYYQIPLDERSRYITRFIHELGVFEYLRAPMGLNASGDEFCARSDEAVEGLDGVVKLIDDILVYADTLEQLFERAENVLKACQEKNITLSLKKLQIGTRTTFAGFDICPGFQTPTQDRIEAIRNFDVPTTLKMLRGFLGLANQLAHFIPDGAQITEPLRALTKVNAAFSWQEEQQRAFQDVKNALDHNLVLYFFNPNLKTFLVTDASRIGLGYLLYQEAPHLGPPKRRLIQCGSRSVSSPESRYAVCELEGLAVQWAALKCKYYLAGMPHFTVLTDHQSLVGLFKKDLSEVQNPRLLKYRENLQGYTFTAVHIPGQMNIVADMLSRNPVWPAEPSDEADRELCQVLNAMEDSKDPLLDPLLKAAADDQEYQSLLEAIRGDVEISVYPNHHPIHEWSSEWKDLSIHKSGLIVKNNERVVVPKSYVPKLLDIMHVTHCGEESTQWLARKNYFWKRMKDDIKKVVRQCKECQIKQPSQAQQPIMQRNQATFPWQVVGSDLFQIDGDGRQNYYLVVVDQYSGFPLIAKFNKAPDTAAVINHLEHWFYIFGVPQQLISDQGPQYASAAFAQYAKQRGFQWVPSSPYHPQSNGLAEAAVKYTKTLLKDHHKDWKKFNEALMLRRNVPNKSGASPAEMFLGHKQRTLLPMLPGQYDFQIENAIKSAQKRKKIRSDDYQNRKRKKLQPFNVGQRVVIKTNKGWTMQGTIDEILHEGRSYNVTTTGGAQLQRNRVMLRPVYEITSDESSDSEAEDGARDAQESESNHKGGIHENARTTPVKTRSSTRVPVPRKPCTCCNKIHCRKLDGRRRK